MNNATLLNSTDTLLTTTPHTPNNSLNKSLAPMVGWLAIAPLSECSATNNGSEGCRTLLNYLLAALNFSGKLNDSQFPYHVQLSPTPNSTGGKLFTSFSHSQTHVAVLLSNYHKIGVDIETRRISPAIAQRYFSIDEKKWYRTRSHSSQPPALTLLWTLKESRIKTQHQGQLFKGISQSVLDTLTPDILNNLLLPNSATSYLTPHRLIGFDKSQNCAWWIEFNQ